MTPVNNPLVPDDVLRAAHQAGLLIRPRYNKAFEHEAKNNRAMELAFLFGLLGHPFTPKKIRRAVKELLLEEGFE